MSNFEERVDVTIHSKHYVLTKEAVIEAAGRLKEEGYALRSHTKYHVIIGSSRFTTTSLFAEALGILPIESQGQQAFRALSQLGFTVVDIRRERKERLSSEARKAK